MSTEAADSIAKRHDVLWFDDGNIVLQADSTLFCVHRSILKRESQLFSDMFMVPQPNGDDSSGDADGTEANPLPVHQVSAEAMANILTMLYTTAGVHLELDNAACMAVLRAAHRLQFHNVRDGLAPLLPKRLSAEERLYLGLSDCGVDDWAQPAFKELVFGSDVHGTSGLDGTPLLGHASWNTIYSTRVQAHRRRIQAISSRNPGIRYCAKHLHASWEVMCSNSDTSSIREKLPRPTIQRVWNSAPPYCDAGQSGCFFREIAEELSPSLAAEEIMVAAAWTKLQNEYCP